MGWGGMLRLCNEFYGKQNDYYFILEAVGKNKTGLGTYNDFSSQHTGNISSSLLYVGSFCMCCQLLIDFITIYTVCIKWMCTDCTIKLYVVFCKQSRPPVQK